MENLDLSAYQAYLKEQFSELTFEKNNHFNIESFGDERQWGDCDIKRVDPLLRDILHLSFASTQSGTIWMRFIFTKPTSNGAKEILIEVEDTGDGDITLDPVWVETLKPWGWQLTIKGARGVGSYISLKMPIESFVPESPSESEAPLGILLLERDEDLARRLKELLIPLGFELCVYRDIQGIKVHLNDRKPFCVILDLEHVFSEDIAFISLIKNKLEFGQVPIIGTFGSLNALDLEQILSRGVDFLLQKPLKLDLLFGVLSKIA